MLNAFCACIAIGLSSGCEETPDTQTFKGLELSRVTSPNGQLDAVLVREDGGGAAGGWEWYVYVVAKGNHGIPQNAHPIFNAGTLTEGTLAWSQDHLLEIHYNIAYIKQFRNLWGLSEIQNVGPVGEHDYLVEIRLVPTSQNYSLLTPDGALKAKN